MSTKLMIVGAVSTLCLSAGLAGAETPAAGAEAPATVSERSVAQELAPMPPRPMHQGPPARRVDAEERQLEWMVHILGLSADQKTAFGRVLEQQRAQRDALQEQLADGGKKLAGALEAAKPVPATVGALMIEQRTLMQKLEVAHDQANQALRELLTAEQRAAFDSLPKPGPRGPMGRGMGPMGRGMGPMGYPEGMPPAPMGPPAAPPGPEPPDGGRPFPPSDLW